MQDLTIILGNQPGALADVGETLGAAGITIMGGGAWTASNQAVAHFLFADGAAATSALRRAGIQVVAVRDVLVLGLNQNEAGQLGKFTRRIAEAGVNIEVLYSDHNHRLILVVNDFAKGKAISEAWMKEQRLTRTQIACEVEGVDEVQS
jgi:hypothetical protein